MIKSFATIYIVSAVQVSETNRLSLLLSRDSQLSQSMIMKQVSTLSPNPMEIFMYMQQVLVPMVTN